MKPERNLREINILTLCACIKETGHFRLAIHKLPWQIVGASANFAKKNCCFKYIHFCNKQTNKLICENRQILDETNKRRATF